jgi:hypothetical protein
MRLNVSKVQHVFHDLQFGSMPRLREEIQRMLRMTALEDLPPSICCFSLIKSPLAYVNKSEVFLVKGGYHVFVTSSVPRNRMTE